MVDSATYDVMLRFDLGSNMLCPIEIWKFDESGPIERQGFYLLLVNEIKSAIIPELSDCLHHIDPIGNKWSIKNFEGPGPVVSERVLEGADIWRDSKMFREMFISDALYSALAKNKLHTKLKGRKCVVKEDN